MGVRRIQNLALWSDYQHRRRKVEREAGGGANEQQLWHGSAQVLWALWEREECGVV